MKKFMKKEFFGLKMPHILIAMILMIFSMPISAMYLAVVIFYNAIKDVSKGYLKQKMGVDGNISEIAKGYVNHPEKEGKDE